MKKITIITTTLLCATLAYGQERAIAEGNIFDKIGAGLGTAAGHVAGKLNQSFQQNVFNHLDVAFTAGSTGLGFDLAMPVGDYFRVRTGATFMPRFEYTMKFGVQVGTPDDPYAAEHFQNLSNFMKGFTGREVDDHVDMIGVPNFHNFKFLIDVFPFKKKNWHFTVGLYAGSNKPAKAFNSTSGANNLLGLSMYNDIYWRCMNNQHMFEYHNPNTGTNISVDFEPIMRDGFESYGSMYMNVGTFKEDFYAPHDILWDHDVYAIDEDEDSPTWGENVCIHHKGDVRFQAGELAYHAGETYRMLPDSKDNMVKVDAIVNKVRPYLGIGYSGALSKDKRSQISIGAGVMLWGGAPKMVTHDGVDLARDLYNLNGQVKDYINVSNKLKIFPVLELRLSQRIF